MLLYVSIATSEDCRGFLLHQLRLGEWTMFLDRLRDSLQTRVEWSVLRRALGRKFEGKMAADVSVWPLEEDGSMSVGEELLSSTYHKNLNVIIALTKNLAVKVYDVSSGHVVYEASKFKGEVMMRPRPIMGLIELDYKGDAQSLTWLQRLSFALLHNRSAGMYFSLFSLHTSQ